jgi:hypothetical protein
VKEVNQSMPDATSQLDPGPILQTAFAFWSSKVLLTAVEFGVFTKLRDRRSTGEELGAELGLHPRGISDFFDALVAMQFLDRDADGPSATYFNTPAGALYLDSRSPRYVGGWLEMLNDRLFKFWHDLPEAPGKQQNEAKHGQQGMFEELYAELPRLEQFMGAMTGLSRINFEAFAARFDFSRFKTLCDLGGALMAIEALIDDARRENVFGLLMPLNMLIEFGDAFDYSGADFRGWCSEVGFRRFEVLHLAGASSAAIAFK